LKTVSTKPPRTGGGQAPSVRSRFFQAIWRTLHRITLWTGPTLVLLLAVASGFGFWVLNSESGTRWLITTAARQWDGAASDIHGSIWDGVRVGALRLALPQAAVEARAVVLEIDWRALRQKRVHVRTLAAETLTVEVHDQGASAPSSSEPVDISTLPFALDVDKLAFGSLGVRLAGTYAQVDGLELTATLNPALASLSLPSLALAQAWVQIDGQDLPLRLDATHLRATLTPTHGTLRLHQLGLAHALAQLALQGDVAWELGEAWGGAQALAWKTLDADLRLLELQTATDTPVHVDALALRAHATPGAATVEVRELALSHALGKVAATADASWIVQQSGAEELAQDLALNIQLQDGSHWSGQPLQGSVQVQAQHAAAQTPATTLAASLQAWRIPKLDAQVRLGENQIRLEGALGRAQDRLDLAIHIPALAEFWPQAPGSLAAQGHVAGSATQHQLQLEAVFTPAKDVLGLHGEAVRANLAWSGAWEHPGSPTQAWRARVTQLRLEHASLQVQATEPFTLRWQPQAPDWQWHLDAVHAQVALAQELLLTLEHQQSRLGSKAWETRGAIAALHINDARIEHVRQWLARVDDTLAQKAATLRSGSDLRLASDWNLRFGDTLEGEWNLRRVAGDVQIPWEPPVPMQLRDFTLKATATRTAAGKSQVRAVATIQTAAMGSLAVTAQTRIRGDWQLDEPDATTIDIRSDMADLAWLSLLSNLPVELGGALSAHLMLEHRADGEWTTQGQVNGTGLRIVYLDEGVRLTDGTLAAHFDENRFVLDGLRFPARLRVVPREWRTREWLQNDAAAQGGSLTVSGDWLLRENIGRIEMTLARYPVVQRADRHAMVSGTVYIAVAADALVSAITGDLTVDAGWVDLDLLGGVPTLDSDVVVRRAGDKASTTPSKSMETALDLSIDLGERFYLTGYGLDSGLGGKLRLRTQNGRLRADGALATRAGTFKAYGQQLRIVRGSLTFQGEVASPVLDIVAVRTGDLAVQAGVRVAGTARKPKIDLISIPEVTDVEKLSWLLLGRGPDNAGGDAMLLLSVGSSFFTQGEPFYRQFGLDELSLRSGSLGATGSVLPVESVVRSLDAGVSDVENQFLIASKNISENFSVSVEQALSETGTVGRISYRLARGINASLLAGTVNGVALVYRWFSRD